MVRLPWVRALHQDLPEFVTLNSARTRAILMPQSAIDDFYCNAIVGRAVLAKDEPCPCITYRESSPPTGFARQLSRSSADIFCSETCLLRPRMHRRAAPALRRKPATRAYFHAGWRWCLARKRWEGSGVHSLSRYPGHSRSSSVGAAHGFDLDHRPRRLVNPDEIPILERQ